MRASDHTEKKSSFSIRVTKYWNRFPTSIVTAPSVNSFTHKLNSSWEELLEEVPNYFYIIPVYAIPTTNLLSYIIKVALQFFCILLPYLYGVIDALCGPHYYPELSF